MSARAELFPVMGAFTDDEDVYARRNLLKA